MLPLRRQEVADLVPRLAHNPGALEIPVAAAPACPVCDGTGVLRWDVPYGDARFGQIRSCPCCHGADAALMARVWAVSGLDADDPQAPSLDGFAEINPATTRMLTAARAFVADPAGWLTFHGTWGGGKSHLGEAIMRALIARGVPTLYLPALRLFRYLGATWRTDEEIDYERRLAWCSGLPVLIVDEWGKESSSEATERLRLELFDARYVAAMRGRGGATVLLSNLPPAAWPDRALASRAQDRRFVVVEVSSLDFRQVER